ncbi:HEAT repeat domain-containing protein [Thioalkalivibrio sp.]|uniref:HEAT repeat domain-containing protein n=1 Tax=Thioalkalivibrio sp. TaxID=2093813 RepID=UPI003566821B
MQKRAWWLQAAVALGVGVLLAVWFRGSVDKDVPVRTEPAKSTEQATLSIQWHPGVSQRYRVLSESSMQMQGTGSAMTMRVHLQGLLDTLTLESDTDQALVGMQLSSVRLEINGTTDAETNRALEVPFRVRFAVNGMPLAFEFPAEVSLQNRSILEGLVRTFQVSLDRGDGWVTKESNSSGTYEAVYRRSDPGRFEKSKRRFTATAAGMVNWSNLSSTEIFSIEAGRDWIAMMEVTEDMSSEGEGGPVMKVRNHASLNLLAGGRANLTAEPWDFAEATTPAVDERVTMKSVPDMTAEQARRLIRTTIPELDATEQGRLPHIHRLRDLLRVDASLPELILDVLKTQEVSDRTRADLYLALELAGTESAQSALASVINDSSWSLMDGMRAIVAMGGVKEPTIEGISALWAASQNDAGGERQRMASSAAFALGSIGNTMRNADDPAYSSLRSDLLGRAFGSDNAASRSDFITALGNTQDPTLASDVVVLLDDTEPAVRRAVALSLGSLGADQVADQLMAHMKREENGYVRSAIAEALQSWTEPTDTAMVMFRQAVRTEADEGTRYNMALLLGKNLAKFPENEPVLREIVRSEPSKRIRQKAAEALAGDR